MISPLMPLSGARKKQTAGSLQEVLNDFVESVASQENSLPRPLMESILHDMVLAHCRAQLHRCTTNAMKSTAVCYPFLARPLQRAFSASELPKMVVSYAVTFCSNQSIQRFPKVAVAAVLSNLIEYIRCGGKIPLNIGQRKALHATCDALARCCDSERNHHHGVTSRGVQQHDVQQELHFMRVQGPAENDAIDHGKIVQQMSILKKGDYWKHLPSEGTEGGISSDFALPPSVDEDEEDEEDVNEPFVDKENIPHLRNRLDVHAHDDDGNGDLDLEYELRPNGTIGSREMVVAEESNGFLTRILPLFSSSDSQCTFFVKKVTDDGWFCASSQEEQEASCHLLRLPSKVAKLGCNGMSITGITLMKRRDNGVLEPCNPLGNIGNGERGL
jgi:hypothetical protein